MPINNSTRPRTHLVDGEHEEFKELLEGYRSEVQPEGHLQQTLFDELVNAAWNLRRVRRMEVKLHATISDEEELLKRLDRLARHHTRFERTLHRSLKALKALQINATPEISKRTQTSKLGDSQLNHQLFSRPALLSKADTSPIYPETQHSKVEG